MIHENGMTGLREVSVKLKKRGGTEMKTQAAIVCITLLFLSTGLVSGEDVELNNTTRSFIMEPPPNPAPIIVKTVSTHKEVPVTVTPIKTTRTEIPVNIVTTSGRSVQPISASPQEFTGTKIAKEPKVTNKSQTARTQITLDKQNISLKENAENVILNSNGMVATTSLPIELDITGVYVKIGDTRKKINILPDMLPKTAKIKQIELKSIEQEPVYAIKATKESKILGLIPISMDIEIEVNANNGKREITKKPWWSVLCSGGDER